MLLCSKFYILYGQLYSCGVAQFLCGPLWFNHAARSLTKLHFLKNYHHRMVCQYPVKNYYVNKHK